MRLPLACAVMLLLVGCGSAGRPAPKLESTRFVNADKPLPYISGFEVEPGTGDFLLTTNQGFWRIGAEDDSVTKLKATVSGDANAVAPVGNYLEIVFATDDRLLGSGHPDGETLVEENLGLIESRDGGGTWKSISEYGRTDLHKIVRLHDRLYAWDAVRSQIAISDDDGLNFVYRAAPPGFMSDFVVDPSDPDHLLFSTEDAVYSSDNQGRSWRVILDAKGVVMSWPEPGALIRVDADGSTYSGTDEADAWDKIGGSYLNELPARIKDTRDPNRRFLVLQTGEIRDTTNGGRRWELVFSP